MGTGLGPDTFSIITTFTYPFLVFIRSNLLHWPMPPLGPNQKEALKALLRLEQQNPQANWHSTKSINALSALNVTVSTMRSLVKLRLVREGPPYSVPQALVVDPPGTRQRRIAQSAVNAYEARGVEVKWTQGSSCQWKLTGNGTATAQAL